MVQHPVFEGFEFFGGFRVMVGGVAPLGDRPGVEGTVRFLERFVLRVRPDPGFPGGKAFNLGFQVSDGSFVGAQQAGCFGLFDGVKIDARRRFRGKVRILGQDAFIPERGQVDQQWIARISGRALVRRRAETRGPDRQHLPYADARVV